MPRAPAHPGRTVPQGRSNDDEAEVIVGAGQGGKGLGSLVARAAAAAREHYPYRAIRGCTDCRGFQPEDVGRHAHPSEVIGRIDRHEPPPVGEWPYQCPRAAVAGGDRPAEGSAGLDKGRLELWGTDRVCLEANLLHIAVPTRRPDAE